MGMYYYRQELDVSVAPGAIYFPQLTQDESEDKYVQIFNRSPYTLPVINQRIIPDSSGFEITLGGMDFEFDPDSEWQTRITFSPHKEGDFEAIYQAEIGEGNGTLLTVHLFGSMLDVKDEKNQLPDRFGIFGISPNPFNSTTTISYSLAQPGDVKLSLYDLQGREIMVWDQARQVAGEHRFVVDAADLTSGIYLVKLNTVKQITTRKIVCIK